MRKINVIHFLAIAWVALFISSCKKKAETGTYEPVFQSLEQVNPVPEWFMDAKLGIYFHWGVYTVPAFSNEWYPRNMYFPGSPENRHHIETFGEPDQFPYDKFITGGNDKNGNFVQFAPKLKSEGGFFDPAEWAQLFADAGAKFAGPVAEHHDGFSMWASRVNPWNARDMGPKLDLVGLLAKEIRNHNMKLILSMHHAYNITGFYENVPPASDPELQMLYGQQGKEKNEALWLAKHKEIIDNYRPDILWQDFNLHVLSEPVLLQFLAYYYNSANEWNKQVVATYKDGLNTKCAVLDYERGGPGDLTENYWLTDDAISSSSWCYTEGIGYYSLRQVFHGFLDRVSKNGNLLLNISPRADGTIPQGQKDVLLGMGNWLKKYGEAVYSTRAWEKYGEGPTKMGSAHGVFESPKEGTSKDVRYTRSKDNTILYAILLGWDRGQEEVKLTSLSSTRTDLTSLKKVELFNGSSANCLPLQFRQDETGLTVQLPEKTMEELAYVVKLSFDGEIPALNNYAEINCTPSYYLSPDGNPTPVLGANGILSSERKDPAQRWRLEKADNGMYKIMSRENPSKVLTATETSVKAEDRNESKSQLWKISHTYNGLLKLSNMQFDGKYLSISGQTAVMVNGTEQTTAWQLLEVCETPQTAYKPHHIPGTIEVEDFDNGCPGDAWYDRDEQNSGGMYRTAQGMDIEVCAAGGYNIGWSNTGEWMAYTLTVDKTGKYRVLMYVATVSDTGKLHLEFDGENKSGVLDAPNTGGYQNWKPLETTLDLEKGTYVLKLVLDNAPSGLNLDKIVFEEN